MCTMVPVITWACYSQVNIMVHKSEFSSNKWHKIIAIKLHEFVPTWYQLITTTVGKVCPSTIKYNIATWKMSIPFGENILDVNYILPERKTSLWCQNGYFLNIVPEWITFNSCQNWCYLYHTRMHNI